MKLVNYKLENAIDFGDDYAFTLVCENADQFSDFAQSFYVQCDGGDGDWILTNGKELSLSKYAVTLLNYFDVSVNDKKIISKVCEQLRQNAYDENFTVKTHETLAMVERYLNDLLLSVDYPVSIGEVDVSQLLKSVNITLGDESDGLLGALVDYVSVLSKLTAVKLLVCVNLRSYLSDEKFMLFCSHCEQNQIRLLLLENHHKTQAVFSGKTLIVDEDLCEFFA